MTQPKKPEQLSKPKFKIGQIVIRRCYDKNEIIHWEQCVITCAHFFSRTKKDRGWVYGTNAFQGKTNENLMLRSGSLKEIKT